MSENWVECQECRKKDLSIEFALKQLERLDRRKNLEVSDLKVKLERAHGLLDAHDRPREVE